MYEDSGGSLDLGLGLGNRDLCFQRQSTEDIQRSRQNIYFPPDGLSPTAGKSSVLVHTRNYNKPQLRFRNLFHSAESVDLSFPRSTLIAHRFFLLPSVFLLT